MGNKITDYKIISEFTDEELTLQVSGYIVSCGWQPFGSPFYTGDEKDSLFCQAMVKYE